MRLITKRDKIRSVAKRWDDQYKTVSIKAVPNKEYISKKLHALNLDIASENDISNIVDIGWVQITCEECDCNDCESAIEFGQPPYYADNTEIICLKCLQRAVQIIKDSNL